MHVVRRVAGYKKIRYYTHENIGYGPVNLPDQELHTTAVWWQLPQPALERGVRTRGRTRSTDSSAPRTRCMWSRRVAVMADARDLQKAVGSGDGAWFAVADSQRPRAVARRRRQPVHAGDGWRHSPQRSSSTTTSPAASA